MSKPLSYSKNAQKKKVNEDLRKIFEKNFNQLNHPIRCVGGSQSGPQSEPRKGSKRGSKCEQPSDSQSPSEPSNVPNDEWPLKSVEGQPFIYGYLNEQTNEVEIYDDSVLLLLNWLGNYGNCYFLDNLLAGSKSNQYNEKRVYERLKKDEALRQAENADSSTSLGFLCNPSNLFELNQDNYRHNLHADALDGLFKEYGKPDVNELVGQLYKRSPALASDSIRRKQFNNFEDTFVQLKNSFNQSFIDREEYILRLDLEEALFLKHAFGILSVQEFVREEIRDDTASETKDDPSRDGNAGDQSTDRQSVQTRNLNLTSLWTRCIRLSTAVNECFITKYAAYFYFRSKGFVVKNGTKFGSDFVLYSRNPMFVHSTYSVLLVKRPADDDSRALKFTNVQAFMRMTKCVVKVNFWLFSSITPMTYV